jgi:hypothetical protein
LLGITSFFLLATEVLRWDLTIATGLSSKNLVIYLLAVFIGLRMVVVRSSLVAAGGLQTAWMVLIAYAIFTWLIAGLVIEYQGYNVISSGIRLKTGLFDPFTFFLVFLFGVRTADDGVKVVKWMLLGALFANLATVLDNAGLVNLGFQERVDGRTQRDGRIQPVRRVHHSRAGHDRGSSITRHVAIVLGRLSADPPVWRCR